VLLLTAYTASAIVSGRANSFFLIYLFWWDEFIKLSIAFLHAWLVRNRVVDANTFISIIKGYFFFLFLYWIFIMVFFGLVFQWPMSIDTLVVTWQILFFDDPSFNIGLGIILLREINFLGDPSYRSNLLSSASQGMITLHISIIFGVLLWAAVEGKFDWVKLDFGKYSPHIYIFPFLLIKLIFDIRGIWMRRISAG
jgi:hypothetical protein